jgi:phosphoribosylaminoimidazole carboxylase PurE protein
VTTGLVVIVMGSGADREHAAKVAASAASFGLDVVQRVGSAHKTPEHVIDLLRGYEEDPRPKVYVTIAGRSNALSGFVDGYVSSPVIACPPPSDAFGGADVFSSIRMPSDVAPLLVLDPGNAGLAAAKILAVADPALRERIASHKVTEAAKVTVADRELHGG